MWCVCVGGVIVSVCVRCVCLWCVFMVCMRVWNVCEVWYMYVRVVCERGVCVVRGECMVCVVSVCVCVCEACV